MTEPDRTRTQPTLKTGALVADIGVSSTCGKYYHSALFHDAQRGLCCGLDDEHSPVDAVDGIKRQIQRAQHCRDNANAADDVADDSNVKELRMLSKASPSDG